ncbi:MAG TPA: hypothetical protein VN420_00215 [Candidatus Fimivivens sp.]|nr:hypothetical protein [Candidatus Fimivivens sp.]
MREIKLMTPATLVARENLPTVPALVQRYLDVEKHVSKGKRFRIVIDGKNVSRGGGGMAYSHALHVEMRDGKAWSRVYEGPMRQYRGAYSHEIDDWDLCLSEPSILEETGTSVTFGLSTGGGNVKVYRFGTENGLERLSVFSVRDYEATQTRTRLLADVVDDVEAFRSYVGKSLGNRWSKDSDTVVESDIVALLAVHYDRDYDAIVDRYELFVWVKGKGFCSTGSSRTGLRHPGGQFYCVGMRMQSVTVIDRGPDFLEFAIQVGNGGQGWQEAVQFRVTWES